MFSQFSAESMQHHFYCFKILQVSLKDFDAVNTFLSLLLIDVDFIMTSYFKVNVPVLCKVVILMKYPK